MSNPAIIEYRIRQGAAANPDNTSPATIMHCHSQELSLTQAGWGQIKEALVFCEPDSRMIVPSNERLRNAEKFNLEMLIRLPAESPGRMNLIEGQVIPLKLDVIKRDNQFYLSGSVYTQGGWVEAIATSDPINANSWSAIGLAFTGQDLLLLKNRTIIARRVIGAVQLAPLGTQDFIIGGEGAQAFRGALAGLRIADSLDDDLTQKIEAVVESGIGEIESKYQMLGGQAGFLGAPTAEEKKIGSGRFRTYQNGAIFWSEKTGAHEVHGAILECYNKHNGPLGFLGFPITDEFSGEKANSRISRFQGGAIYWSPTTGAHEVHHLIFHRYLSLGGESGLLGLPKTDEMDVPGGRKNEFEGGIIFWSPATGAYEVHGPILNHYVSLGGPSSFLGFPISNVEKILRSNGTDSGGRLVHFGGGTIYWSANTGAFEVHGAIREHYEALGGPLGKLGYPLTDETKVLGTDIRYNDFQQGIIVWRPGMGARALVNLRLHIGMVTSGVIDDGISWFKKDKTAELITYLTVKVNDQTLVSNQRRPSGHAGSSYDVDYTHIIAPVRHDTSIYWKVKVMDWDEYTKNDYLGTREETYTIRNLWGLMGGNGQGIYTDMPATEKGHDAPSLHSIKFNYSIQPIEALDPSKHFREQYWWSFENFKTATLSREQFAETFRDVEHVEHWWDKLMSPLDWAIYELAYKGLASKGNCFGMCLQSIYTRKNRSVLAEPLYQYKAFGNKVMVEEADVPVYLRKLINLHHGYQLGDAAVRWYIARVASLDAIRPLRVYERVKSFLAMGDYPIISMFNLKEFSGHAVLPYRCEDRPGNEPHRIYVADPNVPWGMKPNDATWIEIGKNDTFKLVGGTSTYQSQTMLAGLLPSSFLLDLPYHQVSSAPRTPFWEILIMLIMLLGGILLLVGDAETEQVSGNGQEYFRVQDGKKYVVVNAIPNFQRIPLLDVEEPLPEIYAQIGSLPNILHHRIRGRAVGNYNFYLRNPLNAVRIKAPVKVNDIDQLKLTRAAEPRPLCYLSTSQIAKVVELDYLTIIDQQRGDYRRFTASLQMASGAEAVCGMEPVGNSILLQPAGAVQPLNVTFESRLKMVTKRSRLTVIPQAPGELITLRPVDWSTPQGDIVVERLTGIGGTLLERKVKPAQPITP